MEVPLRDPMVQEQYLGVFPLHQRLEKVIGGGLISQ